MKITAFILAILSLMFCWIPLVGFALGLTALILSIVIMNRKDETQKGLTIASIVMAVINLVFGSLISLGVLVSLFYGANGLLNYDSNYRYYNSNNNSRNKSYYEIYKDSKEEQKEMRQKNQKRYDQYTNILEGLNETKSEEINILDVNETSI